MEFIPAVLATVLADDQTDFAFTLESLALKKSANLHVFESIKKEFDSRLSKQQAAELTKQPEEPAISKPKKKEKSIDMSIVKLRAKYKWIKDKWRQYTDRAKSGSGKAVLQNLTRSPPHWFTNHSTIRDCILSIVFIYSLYLQRELRSFLYDLRSTVIKFHYKRFYYIQSCDVVYATLP